jgi:hypothetical protein
VVVLGLTARASWQDKQRCRDRATVATQKFSALREQHISDVFDQIDVVWPSVGTYVEDECVPGAWMRRP